MNDASHRIEAKNREGIGLSIQACWVADRFHHEVLLVTPDSTEPLLKSKEGTPEDDWPTSPPLQDVSVQEIHGNPALLGVGMAGSSHWSLSFMATDEERVAMNCDIACLTRKTPDGPVGSIYRLKSSGQQSGRQVILSPAGLANQTVRIECIEEPDLLHGSIKQTADQLVITPREPIVGPGTVQWKYRIWIE